VKAVEKEDAVAWVWSSQEKVWSRGVELPASAQIGGENKDSVHLTANLIS
jgi:hypothetical protein